MKWKITGANHADNCECRFCMKKQSNEASKNRMRIKRREDKMKLEDYDTCLLDYDFMWGGI